jgi:hypothetical protein
MTVFDSARRNPYPMKARKPVMRRSVVLVIDILGFKTLSVSGGEKEFVRLYDAITRAERWLRQFVPRAYVIKAYTDNIVVCWPWDRREDSELPLGITMLQAAAFQRSLVLSGYCARGAIAVGDVFANSRTVFGPALIEAHEHERSAKHPRVVLARSAVQHAAAHVATYHPMTIAPQNEELLIDLRDRCVFLDYLTSGAGLHDDPVSPEFLLSRERAIAAHRAILLENLTRHAGKIRAKYQWLAAYHNYVVTERLQTLGHIPRYNVPQRFAHFSELAQRLAKKGRARPTRSARTGSGAA